MSDLVLNALRRNLTQAEQVGDVDRVKRLKARIAKLEKAAAKAVGDLTKAELLDAAAEAGVEARTSMTKAELVEALNEEGTD